MIPDLSAFDTAAEIDRICEFLRRSLRKLNRRGLVVAVSGGIDSAACAALAVRAVGVNRTYGVLLPERDSSASSNDRGEEVVRALGIAWERQDIESALEAIGCYRARDDAIREVVPNYQPDWAHKILLRRRNDTGVNRFVLIVKPPQGLEQEHALPLKPYLKIVAATNYKQRLRKSIEYFHGDRLNYAVVGTPNRVEYDQGFFVKNGDGAADVKPIAHLYKTQVYALCRALGLPESVQQATPTTDTYSLPQTQQEFYFPLPYEQMDKALWAFDQGLSVEELAHSLTLPTEKAMAVYSDIKQKRRTTAYLHAPAALLEAG
ncbi:MAG: NAD(+) synthase [Pseudomonadota bacterium]